MYKKGHLNFLDLPFKLFLMVLCSAHGTMSRPVKMFSRWLSTEQYFSNY